MNFIFFTCIFKQSLLMCIIFVFPFLVHTCVCFFGGYLELCSTYSRDLIIFHFETQCETEQALFTFFPPLSVNHELIDKRTYRKSGLWYFFMAKVSFWYPSFTLTFNFILKKYLLSISSLKFHMLVDFILCPNFI